MKSFKQFIIENPPAWHGTPHNVDAFSLNNIGTGEGASAFGWGLYFTASKEVAEYYSGNQGVGGAPVPAFFELNGVRTVRGTPEQKAADLIYSMGFAKARTFAKSMLADAKRGDEWTKANGIKYYETIYSITLNIKRQSEVKKTKGNVYEVIIMADDDQFLNWDKSLSNQSSIVHEALIKAGRTYGINDKDATGNDLYQDLVDEFGDSDKAASQYLLSIGIVGVIYLDALGRGTGTGTHNYVVFDDKLIKIKDNK